MLQSRFLGEHGPGCSAEKARLETGHHLAVRPRFFAEVADPWFGALFCSARQVKFCRAGIRLEWQSIPDFRCDFPWTLRIYLDVSAKVVQVAALSSERQINPLAQPDRLRW